MSESAHVTSLEAIAAFRAALLQFRDHAEQTLLALDQQVARALVWFDREAPLLWKQRIQRCFDDVAAARTRYEACRMRTVAGRRPSCYEEQRDYQVARRRLQEARERADSVRRWARRLHQEADEYRGRTGKLKRFLESDVVKTLGLLERTLEALEAYVDRPAVEKDEPGPNAE